MESQPVKSEGTEPRPDWIQRVGKRAGAVGDSIWTGQLRGGAALSPHRRALPQSVLTDF